MKRKFVTVEGAPITSTDGVNFTVNQTVPLNKKFKVVTVERDVERAVVAFGGTSHKGMAYVEDGRLKIMHDPALDPGPAKFTAVDVVLDERVLGLIRDYQDYLDDQDPDEDEDDDVDNSEDGV